MNAGVPKGRHELMAASVTSAVRGRGFSADAVTLVGRAHALAMAPRIAALDDDHDPAYLHPGRTVLLLLQDVGDVPLTALCAAAVHETERAELRVASDDVRRVLGEEVAETVATR